MNYHFQTGQHYKVHHSYIWLGSLLGVGAVLAVIFLSNIQSVGTLVAFAGPSLLLVVGITVLAILAIYGIAVGVTALSYKYLSFVFDETEFSLYAGIFNKRRVHVPYARVQSVNHKQSLVQRLAGVCTVEIDTAGGSSNRAVRVPYVKLDVGEAIRADLFMRKAVSLGAAPAQAFGSPVAQNIQAGANIDGMLQPTPGIPASANVLDEAALDLGVDNFRGLYGGSFAGMEPVVFERRMANKELALASISQSSVSSLLAMLVVFVAATMAFVVLFAKEALALVMVGMPVAIASFALMIAVTIGTTALSYGSFSVRRRGSRVEVERGILQRDFSGIDIDRIQSIVIRQSFIRRMIGYCEVSLGRIKAGEGNEQNTQATLNAGGLVVHPFIRIDQVDALLAGLVPEFNDRPTSIEFKGLPAIALRRGLIRRCVIRSSMFWLLVCVVVFQIVGNAFIAPLLGAERATFLQVTNVSCVLYYLFFAAITALTVLGTLWWKRGSGFAMTEKYLAICNDGLGSETVYLPRQKIQNVLTRTNPFQRAAHVATIGAVTAAGTNSTATTLWDVTEEDANAWLQWLQPRHGEGVSAPQGSRPFASGA